MNISEPIPKFSEPFLNVPEQVPAPMAEVPEPFLDVSEQVPAPRTKVQEPFQKVPELVNDTTLINKKNSRPITTSVRFHFNKVTGNYEVSV